MLVAATGADLRHLAAASAAEGMWVVALAVGATSVVDSVVAATVAAVTDKRNKYRGEQKPVCFGRRAFFVSNQRVVRIGATASPP